MGVLKDYPGIVNALGAVLVIAHLVAAEGYGHWHVWQELLVNPQVGTELYLGAAVSASILAGFSGVVVVYGLTAPGSRFTTLRAEAGAALPRNWTSTSIAGFLASGLFVGAAVLSSIGQAFWSPWLFELGLFLLMHAAIRIIWLLRELMAVAVQTDSDRLGEVDEAKEYGPEHFGHRPDRKDTRRP